MTYFNTDGSAIDADALFDSDGFSKQDAYQESMQFVEKGGTCDAVRLYWAVEMANTTHCNYTADILFFRSRPSR